MRVFAMSVAIAMTGSVIALSSGCTPAAVTDCHAELRSTGPYVRAGHVWEELRVWCSPSPTSHALSLKLPYRKFEEYTPLDRGVYTPRIPDAAGFTISVHTDCVSAGTKPPPR